MVDKSWRFGLEVWCGERDSRTSLPVNIDLVNYCALARALRRLNNNMNLPYHNIRVLSSLSISLRLHHQFNPKPQHEHVTVLNVDQVYFPETFSAKTVERKFLPIEGCALAAKILFPLEASSAPTAHAKFKDSHNKYF